jgi:hypothetical protein
MLRGIPTQYTAPYSALGMATLWNKAHLYKTESSFYFPSSGVLESRKILGSG